MLHIESPRLALSDYNHDYNKAIEQFKAYVVNRTTIQNHLAFSTYEKLTAYYESTSFPRVKKAWAILVNNLKVEDHWLDTYHLIGSASKELKEIIDKGFYTRPQICDYGKSNELSQLIYNDEREYPFKDFLELYTKGHRQEALKEFMEVIRKLKEKERKEAVQFTADILPSGTFFEGFIDEHPDYPCVFYIRQPYAYMTDQVTLNVCEGVEKLNPSTIKVVRVIDDIEAYAKEKGLLFFEGKTHLMDERIQEIREDYLNAYNI